jgi:hypothetical protein
MKKTSARKRSPVLPDEMRREYRFDYTKAKPNRFAAEMGTGTIAVVLDPDVAAVFQSAEAVNALLRSVIAALPRGSKP